MPWTTPPTFTVNDVSTAAELNIWSDDLNFLHQPPSCRVRKSGPQEIPNATITTLLLDVEDWDNDGMHSTSVNTGRLTATTAGTYVLLGNIFWEQTNPGSRQIIIENQAGSHVAQMQLPTVPADISSPIQAMTIRSLSVTNWVVSRAYHTAGAPLDVLASAETSFAALWVG